MKLGQEAVTGANGKELRKVVYKNVPFPDNPKNDHILGFVRANVSAIYIGLSYNQGSQVV